MAIVKFKKIFESLLVVTSVYVSILPASADITIPYNEYSGSPTIGRGTGTSTDPRHPGYGAMRIFIQKVMDYPQRCRPGRRSPSNLTQRPAAP
jgi:hypothetical protein